MRSYGTTSIRVLLIALAVLSVAEVSAQSSTNCPQYKEAKPEGPIDPNGPWIALSCPEACANPDNPPVFLSWQDSPGADVILLSCEGVSEPVPIPSTSTCWRCLGSCAGDDCPPGELCRPEPGLAGSDCRRYSCTDPAYEPVEIPDGQGNLIVKCRRKPSVLCPPITDCTATTVVIDGPTAIQPGATCSWSAEVWTGCDPNAYTLHWYAANQWVGSGQYYTGGKPNWVANGQSWQLRVEAAYNGSFAGSQQITVSESSSAPMCWY